MSGEVIGIAPLHQELVESMWECFRIVCEEEKYLGYLHAPSLAELKNYTSKLLALRNPAVVAFAPGPKVVGFCDINRRIACTFSHTGILGIYVHPDYRGRGIGEILLRQALKQAMLQGIERIELEVFESNTRAIKLYEKWGFELECIRKRGRKCRGKYEDVRQMVRWINKGERF